MKSENGDNPFFQQDLHMLETLCGKHLIEPGEGQAVPKFCTPLAYYETYDRGSSSNNMIDIDQVFNFLDQEGAELGLGKIGDKLRNLFSAIPSAIPMDDTTKDFRKIFLPDLNEQSSQLDVLRSTGKMMSQLIGDKEFYKGLRKSISENGLQLDQNSGNWEPEEVIANIDAFLLNTGLQKDFLGYIDYIYELRNEKPDHMTYFSECYNMLDLMGYKSDKLPKPTDTAMNIYTDAQHAYYAGYCDFFVVEDKNLSTKSQVLFRKFGLKVRVLAAKDCIREISQVLWDHQQDSLELNFFERAMKVFESGKIEKTVASDSQIDAYFLVSELPVRYFDYFTHAVVYEQKNEGKRTLFFRRMVDNFSNFHYYTELEHLYRKIATFFGWTDHIDFEQIDRNIYANEQVEIGFSYPFGTVGIQYTEDGTRNALLVYTLDIRKE